MSYQPSPYYGSDGHPTSGQPPSSGPPPSNNGGAGNYYNPPPPGVNQPDPNAAPVYNSPDYNSNNYYNNNGNGNNNGGNFSYSNLPNYTNPDNNPNYDNNYHSINNNPSAILHNTPSAEYSNDNQSTAGSNTITPQAANRLVYGKDDALFGSIERQQAGTNFGTILDAGTGLHSLRWLATLLHSERAQQVVAVTADASMQRNCQREVEALGVIDKVDVIIGNWFTDQAADPAAVSRRSQLARYQYQQQQSSQHSQSLQFPDGTFDVILADYLIGAMDGFSPYAQDQMIPTLARLLKPGGRLYIVGLQPLPDQVPGDEGATLICRVRQVRDACILMAGHRCYREYPVDWIQRQVMQCGKPASLTLQHTSQFPILYKQETIVKQINVARSKFQYFSTPALATSFGEVLDDLEIKTLQATQRSPTGRIQLGFDYIVTAQRKLEEEEEEEDDDDDDDDDEDDEEEEDDSDDEEDDDDDDD